MNLMLFAPGEFQDGTLLIRGGRARELIRTRRIKTGDKVRVGALNGLWGWGTVVEVSEEVVTVHAELNQIDLVKPLTLVVGLSRPQIFKKVIQIGAMWGVSSIVFVRAARSEKSFLQSPQLADKNIAEQIQLGLEQGIGTTAPEVKLFTSFAEFKNNWLLPNAAHFQWKLIAEPKAHYSMASFGARTPINPMVSGALAVGPDPGWQEDEIEAFISGGFQSFSLGTRILRVDVALSFILGQIALIGEKCTNFEHRELNR